MGIIRRLFSQLLTDKQVQTFYVNAGKNFGDAVSYIFLEECLGFDAMHTSWAEWEREYAHRGFRTISVDDFIAAGGYGRDISPLVGVKREEGEIPILHAKLYEDYFLGKIKPAISLDDAFSDGDSVEIQYQLPSTQSISDSRE